MNDLDMLKESLFINLYFLMLILMNKKNEICAITFLGMSNLIQIEDNQTHYTIDLPMQKPIIGMNYTYGINRKRELILVRKYEEKHD